MFGFLFSSSWKTIEEAKSSSVLTCDHGTEDETAKCNLARNRKALTLLWVYLEVTFKNKD